MAELLLVDDEIPVRLALRTLGDWASCGVTALHEASNGREALDRLEAHPDIAVMITDIKMPVMDGIELIAHARRSRPDLVILVLSAFEDYDLIREAFRRGAADYILKPRLEPEAVVAQVAGFLVPRSLGSAHPRTPDPSAETQTWLRALVEASALDLTPPAAPASTTLPLSNLSVLCLWVDDFQRVKARYLEHSLADFQARLEDLLGRFAAGKPGARVLGVSPQEYLVFVPWSTKTWGIEARHATTELCHQLRHFLEIKVSVGVSTPVHQARHLTSALREARALVQLRHLLGRDRVILPPDARDLVLSAEGLPLVDATLFLAQAAAPDFPRARQSWSDLVQGLTEYQLPSIRPYRQVALQLVGHLLEVLSAAGTDAADVAGADRDPAAELEALEDLDSLVRWLNDWGRTCLDGLERRQHLVSSHHILRARRYLEGHYADPELSLDEVARHVGLSRTYFSTLFEKDTGTGYSEYLNALRIREAQRLLKTTTVKVYEVGERCGFNSVEYFGRLFRKLVGVTPAQFRGK